MLVERDMWWKRVNQKFRNFFLRLSLDRMQISAADGDHGAPASTQTAIATISVQLLGTINACAQLDHQIN